ncbi:uncharacterized protein RHIMIDRAFT_146 [Rhizopus microsporus ATCC 52813]|uniref:Uncharacterized protein n=1 Tax=Rhizopus microsporus ATCC 52813 TaxID=1340429 RepID=A0A2G4T785_RHIZD|nr:uncharacterized protein RHIMIDRAFT_146 [Rhizopus microsporus ATCC 52813]PHZ16851.1 hypothetical protein RHIMIDRAFT_146 [Rhizopus microsporus ATCC 52813]
MGKAALSKDEAFNMEICDECLYTSDLLTEETTKKQLFFFYIIFISWLFTLYSLGLLSNSLRIFDK